MIDKNVFIAKKEWTGWTGWTGKHGQGFGAEHENKIDRRGCRSHTGLGCNPMPSWSSAIPGRRRRRLKHVPVLRPLLLLRLHSPQIRGKTALPTQIRSDASCGVYGRSAIRVFPIFHGYNSAQNRAFWGLAGPETPRIAPDFFNNCFVCKDLIH